MNLGGDSPPPFAYISIATLKEEKTFNYKKLAGRSTFSIIV